MKLALLFPGQGAQFVGMGKDLAESFPSARRLFEEADALLGYSLSRLSWEGPAEALTRTEHCQPAIYVASMAALAALDGVMADLAVTPVAAAGLSLGEYTALAAAGALSFQDGLRLVRLRGQAMEDAAHATPGTMASILGMELDPLEAICTETGAEVANLNAPGQIVISGTPESVGAASRKAKEQGAKRVIPLEVGGAFHSRLMRPAGAKLQEALRSAKIRMPRFQVLSNVTGSSYTQTGQIPTLLVEQLTHPVQWVQCMQTLLEEGVQTFLEIGPGTVLKGLLRKIDPEAKVYPVGASDEVRQVAERLSTQPESS